jgi:hypothetical protein
VEVAGTGVELETVSCGARAKTNADTSGRPDKRRKNRSGRLVIVELKLNAFWRGIAFLSIIKDVSLRQTVIVRAAAHRAGWYQARLLSRITAGEA